MNQRAIRGIKQSSFSCSIPEVVEGQCLATICGYLHTTEQHFHTAVQGWISDERIGEMRWTAVYLGKFFYRRYHDSIKDIFDRWQRPMPETLDCCRHCPAANVPMKSGGGAGTRRRRRRPTSASRAPPRPPGRAAGRARTFKRWTPTRPGRRPCGHGSINSHRSCSVCCAPN